MCMIHGQIYRTERSKHFQKESVDLISVNLEADF